jgi:hypothetical protein
MAVTPYKEEESPGDVGELLTGQFSLSIPMLRSIVSRWWESRDGMDGGVSETGALKV